MKNEKKNNPNLKKKFIQKEKKHKIPMFHECQI